MAINTFRVSITGNSPAVLLFKAISPTSIILNVTAGTIVIGNASVSNADGFRLDTLGITPFNLKATDEIWAISSSPAVVYGFVQT